MSQHSGKGAVRAGVPILRMDQERVESWVRAQMALSGSQSEAEAAESVENAHTPPGKHCQHATPYDAQVEVLQVTPFRSECGTHTLYALTCRKGEKQWRIFERYSSIRRIYDIARVSYPFVTGTSRGNGDSVRFPERMLLRSSHGALQRAEGLLLWLATYSHVPVVSDFLMGDKSISSGAVNLSLESPVQSIRSTRSRSEASTVGHDPSLGASVNQHSSSLANRSRSEPANGQLHNTTHDTIRRYCDGHEDSGIKGEMACDGQSEAGSSQLNFPHSPVGVSSSDSNVSQNLQNDSESCSCDSGSNRRAASTARGNSVSFSLGGASKRSRVAFLPVNSPVREMSPCSGRACYIARWH